MADKRIAAATGTATGGGAPDLHWSEVQNAMDAAAQECFNKGITDPDKVKDAKLKARERVKSDHQAAVRKAEREARAAKR